MLVVLLPPITFATDMSRSRRRTASESTVDGSEGKDPVVSSEAPQASSHCTIIRSAATTPLSSSADTDSASSVATLPPHILYKIAGHLSQKVAASFAQIAMGWCDAGESMVWEMLV